MKNSDTVTIEEAAKILGISHAAMRARVHRHINEKRDTTQPIPRPKKQNHQGQYRWVFDRAAIIKYRDSL